MSSLTLSCPYSLSDSSAADVKQMNVSVSTHSHGVVSIHVDSIAPSDVVTCKTCMVTIVARGKNSLKAMGVNTIVDSSKINVL